MSRPVESRAFVEYCAHAVGRHLTWPGLLADIRAQAARLSIELTESRIALVFRWYRVQRQHSAKRKTVRNGLKRKRRIELWSIR